MWIALNHIHTFLQYYSILYSALHLDQDFSKTNFNLYPYGLAGPHTPTFYPHFFLNSGSLLDLRPDVAGRRQGDTLDKSADHCTATKEVYSHHVQVFKLWEEAGDRSKGPCRLKENIWIQICSEATALTTAPKRCPAALFKEETQRLLEIQHKNIPEWRRRGEEEGGPAFKDGCVLRGQRYYQLRLNTMWWKGGKIAAVRSRRNILSLD